VAGVHRILEKETTMSVPLDLRERFAAMQKAKASATAMQKAKASATATYEKVMQTPPPVVKQVRPPERTSPTWQKLLTEAQVKFNTGLALSMPDALGLVAKEQPALYELYRQEQLAQCGANPVKKSQPPAPATQQQHPAVAELETRLAKVLERAPSLSRAEAWSTVMQSPGAEALYKSYRERRG
jgi:hypothetical protein